MIGFFSFCFWSYYAAYWFAFWKKYRLHCWKTCMYHVLFRSIFFGVIFSFVLYKVWYVQCHFKCVHFLPLFCVFALLSLFSICTVPETFYFPTWTVSVRWAHAERNERAQTEWTVNARWTICERKMNDLFGVPRGFSLHCISSVIRKK